MEKIIFVNNQAPYINDTNLNQMQDNIEEAIELSEQYSTNEIKIGNWIDNKPIYRKVFVKEIDTTTTYHTFSIGISNIDKVWINGNSYLLTYNSFKKSLNSYESSEHYIRAELNASNQIAVNHSTDNYYSGTAYIILEYTKTTD